MFNQIVSMFGTALSSIVGWFNDVLSAAGMVPSYLAVAFLTLLSVYILNPLFRSGIRAGSSDIVRKNKSK